MQISDLDSSTNMLRLNMLAPDFTAADYEAVLRDLRQKRAAIDAAIFQIECIVKWRQHPLSRQAPFAQGIEASGGDASAAPCKAREPGRSESDAPSSSIVPSEGEGSSS